MKKKNVSKRQMLKRTLAVVLALAMTITGVPVTALAETADDSSKDYPVAQMTYTAGSEELTEGLGWGEGPVSYAFDENEATLWHTDYAKGDVSNGNFWVEMKLAEATYVDAVRYLPAGTDNGDIGGYKVEGTADGETWTLLTEGTWDDVNEWKIAEFEAVEVVGVRLTATSTYSNYPTNVNGYANAKEIRVRTAEAPAPTPEVPTIEVSERVQGIMDNMTLEEKIAQMMMVDFRKWGETTETATDFTVMNDTVSNIISEYDFGSIILFANNIKETEQSYNLTMAMQEAATKDGDLALLISADQEGGSVYRLGSGTALPGNMALGATFDAGNSYEAGKIIGSELQAVGINTNLAPVVDVNNNANNPVIGLRSYGDDATAVGEMAAASIEGMAEFNVVGCAKHFPGHGDTATDSHYGLPIVDKSLDVLREVELKPYEVAIEEGIEMIMTAHILYPQLEGDKILSAKTGEEESLPATMSDDILTGLLKEDMGFDGIIVTDAMNMAGIADKWDQVQSVKIAIASGADMICMPCQLYCEADLANLDAILDGLKAAVEAGEIPESRINDAVARILTVKENRGILDYNAEDYTLENALATVGSDANRAMEREIAAAAVTVVKNENNVLPLELTKDSKVLMLVPYNNERAQMLMAWNRAVDAGIIPYGAEVDYYRFSNATVNTTLQEKLEWADVVIINSEVSSTAKMEYKNYVSALPKAVTDYCKEKGKISVISSVDKPYDVQMYPNADAILAAYGCKGSSVDPTEALIGGATGSAAAYGPNIIAAVEVALGTFGAQGKLPVNVPVYDVEANAYTEEIVYARGYGLTYEAKAPIAVDKAALEAKVAEVKDTDTSLYTEETAAAFAEALAAAQEVLANEDATQYILDEALAALEEAIVALELKPVDKAALEAKVAEVKDTDTSVYTEETAAAFAEALAKAQEVAEKEDATQEEVDEALAALETAFAGLTEKPAEPVAFDLTVLAKNATASSEQDPPAWTNDGYASWAFDTENHWWHTKYSNEGGNGATNSDEGLVSDTKTQWIQTGFDKVWYLDHITYVSRGENMNCFNAYKVYVANMDDPTQAPTDEDFGEAIKVGNLENLSTEQTIQLDEVVAATHVRIEVLSVHLGAGRAYVAAKQIQMYGYDEMPGTEEPVVDKAALEAKVTEYADVDTTAYTEETAAAFAEALEAAQAVAAKEDATQEEVDEALAALEAAFAGLTEKPVDPEPEVDKAALEAKVAEYADVDTTAYTEETAAAFAEALAKAQEVAAKEDATQEEVNEALAALEAAFAGLTEKPVDPEPEKTYIPVKGVTAGDEELVNSNQSVEGPCGLAIDGDESTIWHTDWYVGPNYDDHWIQLEFDSAYMVGGFEYLPRQTGNTNGMITSYKIFVSEDGENWEEVAAGNWDSADRSWQTVEFDAVKAKYVRLKSEGGESDIGIALTCAAEIRAIGAAVECTEHQTELRGAKEADCTEAGYTGDTVCTICLTVVEKGEEIAALGHAWGEPVVVEATCTEDGSSTKTCATCGEEEKEVLKANGHTLGEYKVVKEATCTEAGSEEAECSVCKETETKEIPALGHAWGEWEEVTAAKYSAAGLEKRVCGTCGEAEEREIAKLANPFEDVQNDYYYDPVMWALDEGITTGQSATIFGVNVGTKREEVVTFLWRYAGSPEPTQTSCTFKDVEAGQYYYKAILWANEEGIVNGYNADKFGVGDTCKRQDIVKIFWGYAGNEEAENDTCEFTDVEAGQYYYPAVLWAVENKITTGQTATTFGVGEDCNRQDFVTFLYRLELLSAEEVAE